jgi:hypothetical protein
VSGSAFGLAGDFPDRFALNRYRGRAGLNRYGGRAGLNRYGGRAGLNRYRGRAKRAEKGKGGWGWRGQ